jgi:hypothetical protein
MAHGPRRPAPKDIVLSQQGRSGGPSPAAFRRWNGCNVRGQGEAGVMAPPCAGRRFSVALPPLQVPQNGTMQFVKA